MIRGEYESEYAKRALGFQAEAQILLASYHQLVEQEVFENTGRTDENLKSLKEYVSAEDRKKIEKMRDTNDHNSAYETAILVFATALSCQILEEIADKLDLLGRKWNALDGNRNTRGDIYPPDVESGDNEWVLNTAYVFISTI